MSSEKLPSKDRFLLKSAVHLLLIQDNWILLLRRFNTGYEDGNFSVPAGHLDGNEAARVAMAREAREESGIEIDPSDLKLVHLMHRKAGDERMDLFFTAERWKGNPKITEPDKCDLLEWFHLDSLPSNTITYVRSAIKMTLNNRIYSEFGFKL